MAPLFEKQEFQSFYDQNSGQTFEDLEFRRCTFNACAISITHDPHLRSTVRHTKLIRCKVANCSLRTAILEDVLVQGLATDSSSSSMGAVFKHVTLQGKIGTLRIRPSLAHTASAANQQAFAAANAAYYATVDWAVDICEAAFQELSMEGVPARLVRRDPATQVVVTRASALAGAWRALDLSGTYWPISLSNLIHGTDPDMVLAAPKQDRHYPRLLEGLQILRDAGIAEPD